MASPVLLLLVVAVLGPITTTAQTPPPTTAPTTPMYNMTTPPNGTTSTPYMTTAGPKGTPTIKTTASPTTSPPKTTLPKSPPTKKVTPSTPVPTMPMGYVVHIVATILGDYDPDEEEYICKEFSSVILAELQNRLTAVPMPGPCSTRLGSTIVEIDIYYSSEPPDIIVEILTQLDQGRFVDADRMVYNIASIVVDIPGDDRNVDDNDDDDAIAERRVILLPVIISAASFAVLILIIIIVISICYCCCGGRVPMNRRRNRRRSRYNHLTGWRMSRGMALPAAQPGVGAQPGYLSGVYGAPLYTSPTPSMAYSINQSCGGINWGNCVVQNQPSQIPTEPNVIKVQPGTRLNIVVT